MLTELADASTRFKVLKTKAVALGTLNASIRTMVFSKEHIYIDNDVIKNMMELRNQELHRLREDDERFEIILLTIKAYVSRNNAALSYDIIKSRQSSLTLKLKEDEFLWQSQI